MTNRKIVGWLLLKDLPGIPAFTQADIRTEGVDSFFNNTAEQFFGVRYLHDHPDFFLPIYEGEEVCPDCKGAGCSICNGNRKVAIKSEKPKCKKCGGAGIGTHDESSVCPSCDGTGTQDWQWPPVEGQEVWLLDALGYPMMCVVESVITTAIITIKTDGGKERAVVDFFPTRTMAEEYTQWRKERGI